MADRRLVYRHRWPVRLWHWLNALGVIALLMSGLMIFNAHPRLYWGKYGANTDCAWLQIGSVGEEGRLTVGRHYLVTTGVLGRWRDPAGNIQRRAFPWWATIPSSYSLAAARRWHLFFAWVVGLTGAAYLAWSLLRGHARRDLAPTRDELAPRHLWQEVKDHARLRLPTGEGAARYNALQKIAYCVVLFLLLPLIVLTGLAMSPGMNAAWPWVLDLFGGRQSARSLHFIAMAVIAGFTVVHLVLVILAGAWNEVRSMMTGRWRVPE